MMSTKHTPGPWRVSYTNFSEVQADNGALIAKCDKLNGLVNLQANARLIAAAPELLQELKNIANAKTAEWDDPTDFEAWAKSRARAAIAKATGKQQ